MRDPEGEAPPACDEGPLGRGLTAIGPYRVLGRLGQGGAAAVFHAVAPDGREVAVKVLLPGHALADAARLEREARLLADPGPGFVPVLDRGSLTTAQAGALPYLVLPYLPGGTLGARLREGPLSIDEAVALGHALAAALARLHARGAAHRDLKPSNVLLDAEGAPWIADLGLGVDPAAVFEGVGRLTATGEVGGTPGYMAPEQMSGLRYAGASVDVFALGAVLYEALAGRPAFDGERALHRMARAAIGRVQPLGDLRPEAPAWLVARVHACLAVDPAERPTAADLARAFERGGAPPRAQEHPRRRLAGALAAGALAAVALGAGLGAVAARRRADEASAAQPARTSPEPDRPTPGDGDPAPVATAPPAVGEAPAGEPGPPATGEAPPAELTLPRVRARGCRVTGAWPPPPTPASSERPPSPDDARIVGLAWPAPGLAVALDRGGGVRPLDPRAPASRPQAWAEAGALLVGAWAEPGGTHVAALDETGALRLWPTANGRRSGVAQTPSTYVAVAGRGRRLVTLDDLGIVRMWDTEEILNSRPGSASPSRGTARVPDARAIAVLPDRVAVGDERGGLVLVRDGGDLAERGQVDEPVRALAALPQALVVGGAGGAVLTISLRGGAVTRWGAHGGPVREVVTAPGARRVVTSGDDGLVRVWDAATGAELATLALEGDLEGGEDRLARAAWAPDGGALLVGTRRGAVLRVDVPGPP